MFLRNVTFESLNSYAYRAFLVATLPKEHPYLHTCPTRKALASELWLNSGIVKGRDFYDVSGNPHTANSTSFRAKMHAIVSPAASCCKITTIIRPPPRPGLDILKSPQGRFHTVPDSPFGFPRYGITSCLLVNRDLAVK